MEFRELSDGEWGVIAVFLPLKPKRCWRALSDDGSLINGILYVITAVYQLGCKFKVF
jgi:transposase